MKSSFLSEEAGAILNESDIMSLALNRLKRISEHFYESHLKLHCINFIKLHCINFVIFCTTLISNIFQKENIMHFRKT